MCPLSHFLFRSVRKCSYFNRSNIHLEYPQILARTSASMNLIVIKSVSEYCAACAINYLSLPPCILLYSIPVFWMATLVRWTNRLSISRALSSYLTVQNLKICTNVRRIPALGHTWSRLMVPQCRAVLSGYICIPIDLTMKKQVLR